MSAPTTAVGWLASLVTKRPAELTTAAAGGLGLVLATVLDAGEDVRTALVIVVATLPAVVSYLHDLGRYGPGGRRRVHELTTELDALMIRAVHRARAGHPSWKTDLDVVKALIEVERSRSARPGTDAGGDKPPVIATTAPGGGGKP